MSPILLGKKVFFIYPHSVIQNKLVQELIDREYEVYFIHDHNKVESICEYYTSPILFINIDEGLEEYQWEKLIRHLSEKESSSHAKFGIVTYNENIVLKKKYLMDLMVPCGFITLKLGLSESTEIIINTLKANEVKGKRKYVRAKCTHNEAKLNVSVKGKLYDGDVVDISSVGMAITFVREVSLKKNSYLKDIQLKLKGILLRVSAIIVGYREVEGEKTLYVLIFDKNVNLDMKSKLRSFISKTLQSEMERKLQIN